MYDTIARVFLALLLTFYSMLAVLLIAWTISFQLRIRFTATFASPVVRLLRGIRFVAWSLSQRIRESYIGEIRNGTHLYQEKRIHRV